MKETVTWQLRNDQTDQLEHQVDQSISKLIDPILIEFTKPITDEEWAAIANHNKLYYLHPRGNYKITTTSGKTAEKGISIKEKSWEGTEARQLRTFRYPVSITTGILHVEQNRYQDLKRAIANTASDGPKQKMGH